VRLLFKAQKNVNDEFIKISQNAEKRTKPTNGKSKVLGVEHIIKVILNHNLLMSKFSCNIIAVNEYEN